jgi:hypothetical protein
MRSSAARMKNAQAKNLGVQDNFYLKTVDTAVFIECYRPVNKSIRKKKLIEFRKKHAQTWLKKTRQKLECAVQESGDLVAPVNWFVKTFQRYDGIVVVSYCLDGEGLL